MVRLVVMGVSGCGKSSVGSAVAKQLGIDYFDGDDLHPVANIEKMRQGKALDDDDRWPWLDAVAETLTIRVPVVVGCSALKRNYRDRIRAGAGGPVRFVHLFGSHDLLAARLNDRQGHFMPSSLLDSQIATLEPPSPDEALSVDIAQPIETLANIIIADLKGMTT